MQIGTENCKKLSKKINYDSFIIKIENMFPRGVECIFGINLTLNAESYSLN